MKKLKNRIKILACIMVMLAIYVITGTCAYAMEEPDFEDVFEDVVVDSTTLGFHLSPPANIQAYRQSDTSIRLEWDSGSSRYGYIIYQYDSSSGKYVKIHTVPPGTYEQRPILNWTKRMRWIDDNLETNRVYKYKIMTYGIYEERKEPMVKSKLSSWVSARTYTRDSEIINAKAPVLNRKTIFLEKGASRKMSVRVEASGYGTNENKQPLSPKVRWRSSNKSIAKVDKNGVITAGKHTGTCKVYARAHNGAQTELKVVVRKKGEVQSFGAPANIRAYRHSDTATRLEWETVSGADGYIIYRYNSSSGKYARADTVACKKAAEWITWTDKNLETNKVYKYKIAAYKKKNGKKNISGLSDYVSAKTYKRNSKKINARAPKLKKTKVNLMLCSSKKIKVADVKASRYGKNKNKEAFSTKVRWYSSNPSIATVDKNGVITAGTKAGTCSVYAKSHNGARTRVKVHVKNYAKVKSYYNYSDKHRDIAALLTDYKKPMQNIAEYYAIHRVKKTIKFTLNDEAEVVISPANADIGNLQKDIETLLVDFPFFISVQVESDGIIFKSRLEDDTSSPAAYVEFFFDDDCDAWPDIRIASHWTAYRFVPH